MNPICVIAGLTATGKSKAAINLAKHWNAEIISADSVAVYKHLNIGSAKVSHLEQEGIKHHLIDYCELDEVFSVAEFQKEGRRLIKEIQDRGKNVIVVGGTGLYIKALLNDYRFKEEPSTQITERQEDTKTLYQLLLEKDAATAKTIHPNNRKRIMRALDSFDYHEIERHTLNENQRDVVIINAKVFFLQGDRDKIYDKINARTDKMVELGLVQEISNLLKQDKTLFNKQALNSIGYKEFKEYFENNQSLETTIELIKRNTRRFAKRQITWFKHQQEAQWIDIFNENVDSILLEWTKTIK